MLKGGVGQKQPSEERCRVIRSNSPPLNKKEKVLKGEGRCQALLDAESELVSIAGLLWDRDVIPGTQTREEANKGERRPTERRSWAEVGWWWWGWGGCTTGESDKEDLRR